MTNQDFCCNKTYVFVYVDTHMHPYISAYAFRYVYMHIYTKNAALGKALANFFRSHLPQCYVFITAYRHAKVMYIHAHGTSLIKSEQRCIKFDMNCKIIPFMIIISIKYLELNEQFACLLVSMVR